MSSNYTLSYLDNTLLMSVHCKSGLLESLHKWIVRSVSRQEQSRIILVFSATMDYKINSKIQ